MQSLKVAIIGNPNSGKSTLFNALTGAKQIVGNWPGVTVERKSGYFTFQGKKVEVVDLPGIYTLTTTTEESSIDASIACDSLLNDQFDLILNVIDINNLERNLYLTTQLLEMKQPVLVVANMEDVAQRRGISVDVSAFSTQLGCPVIGISATQKSKIMQLKQMIADFSFQSTSKKMLISYPAPLQQSIAHLSQKLRENLHFDTKNTDFLALRLLEGSDILYNQMSAEFLELVKKETASVESSCGEEVDILLADARYTFAHQLSHNVLQKKHSQAETLTQKIDKVVLHRFLGIPIFLGMIYAMFFFSINIAGAFQDFFDIASTTIFVDGLAELLTFLRIPLDISLLLTVGIGTGISTVLTFIPVICGLFLFLSFLESSGYMARASFVVDRGMRALGLPGKSFVPLIVGFGCNVPAIMATRTLEQRRDRLLTLMMTPFMSCGARMAIYTVFTAAFFPNNGQNVVFFLYLIGIVIALLTGLILKKTLLKGTVSSWVVELPTYHVPTPLALWNQTWHRLKQFIFQAGKYIVPACLILSTLNALTFDHGKITIDHSGEKDSVLATMSKSITPVFAPMGIEEKNWPATVGLVSGVLAKEVVVGTLNTLYTQMSNAPAEPKTEFSVIEGLKEAVLSIPTAFAGLKDSFSNPITAVGGENEMTGTAMGLMSQYFDGTVGALAYLLFVLLYFPCVSAVAAMIRESNIRWALFSMGWTTGLAYIVAVVFYQSMTFMQHPGLSTFWIVSMLSVLGITLWSIKWYANTLSSTTAIIPSIIEGSETRTN